MRTARRMAQLAGPSDGVTSGLGGWRIWRAAARQGVGYRDESGVCHQPVMLMSLQCNPLDLDSMGRLWRSPLRAYFPLSQYLKRFMGVRQPLRARGALPLFGRPSGQEHTVPSGDAVPSQYRTTR